MPSTADLLADAQEKYHALMTGTAVVKLRDQNGEEITYNAASATKLLAYIQSLQDTLNPSRRINGPMRVWF